MQDLQGRVLERSIPVPMSGCWLWTWGVSDRGYGQIRYGDRQRGAHVAAFEAFVGEIPDGMWVLHRCDVRCCVNPDHLYLGTHEDNMRDMREKLRAPKQKLTAVQIREINACSLSLSVLARKFGVSKSAIGYVRRAAKSTHMPPT